METVRGHLGLASVLSYRRGVTDPQQAEFQRLLRQIESGAQEFNLDSSIVHLATEVAAFEGALTYVQRLALIMLIVASSIALDEGSTRLPVTGDESRETMRRLLTPLCGDAFGADGAAVSAREIDQLLTSGGAETVIGRHPGEYKPLIYIPPFIYHQRIRAAEIRLAESIGPRLRMDKVGDEKAIAEAIADVAARPVFFGSHEVAASAEQRAAVASAASRNYALISGGPGTGKTSTIIAILRVLVRLGISPGEIALAAPTGRAAFRMGESVRQAIARLRNPAYADELIAATCPEPSTVHRLLGYSPGSGTFARHRNNPLAAAVVLIDESSMLDLMLTDRLVGSLRPEARLIMLGDADQLPSVAAGAVFRDLAATAEQRFVGICTRLTHSYRTSGGEHGQTIEALTSRINDGWIEDPEGRMLLAERAEPDDLRFEGAEFLRGSLAKVERFIHRWYLAKVNADAFRALKAAVYVQGDHGFEPAAIACLDRIFDHAAAARILCPTRVLPSGADAINAMMHRRAAHDLQETRERWGPLPGEPVMIVRNDYTRTLFNGDQGIVLKVRSSGGREELKAVFRRGGGYSSFHLAALRESLELGYASTIHKAQGSEFDAVAIILPDQDIPILTRELLYTAVSRARNSVVVYGDSGILRTAISRTAMRFSGLGDLLGGSTQKPQTV